MLKHPTVTPYKEQMVLIWISLIANDTEHLFICLLVICISLYILCPLNFFFQFFLSNLYTSYFLFLFVLCCLSFYVIELIYSGYRSLIRYMICFNFDKVQFLYFSFIASGLSATSKEPMPNPRL